MSWNRKNDVRKSFSGVLWNEARFFNVEKLFQHKQVIQKHLSAKACRCSLINLRLLLVRDFQKEENTVCIHGLTVSNNDVGNQSTTLRRTSKRDKQSLKQDIQVLKKERRRDSRKRSCEATETVNADSGIKENKSLIHANSPHKASTLSVGAFPAAKTSHNKRGTENSGQHERKHAVHCEVHIISWRERRISASICIEATEGRVWNVLTDYERLAEFIPNLVHSEIIPCPHSGRIWLLQRGMHTAMYWHIEASVVLDLQECLQRVGGKELHFSMVDGDFKVYSGRWFLRPGSKFGTTILHYEVNVIPRLLFPAAFIERIIKADLPVNLCALAERAEADPVLWGTCPSILKSMAQMPLVPQSLSKKSAGEPLLKATFLQHPEGSQIFGMKYCLEIPDSASLDDKISLPLQAHSQKPRLSAAVIADRKWTVTRKTNLVKRTFCVDEVHLRRLNDPLMNGQHWRVITAITVEAPIEDVWAALTAYENLPAFIPNLSQSKVLFKEDNRVRILQEGCKYLLYMALHARVVLDLFEKPKSEITFQQVEGDFDSFCGRWTLEPLGNQHTVLKYVADMRIHKDFLFPDAIIEEVVYEDLPENLCAIRDQVEFGQGASKEKWKQAQELSEGSNDGPTCPLNTILEPNNDSNICPEMFTSNIERKRRLPVPGLQRDFRVLEKELLKFIAENGKLRVMPLRQELRQSGRIDLEKAITRMGGFICVAAHLGFALTYKQRKPKGYWDSLENLRHEIHHFQKDNKKDTDTMPTRRTMEKAGRYDLSRALEKWGGLMEVAQLLGLKSKRSSTLTRNKFSKVQEAATHDTTTKKVF